MLLQGPGAAALLCPAQKDRLDHTQTVDNLSPSMEDLQGSQNAIQVIYCVYSRISIKLAQGHKKSGMLNEKSLIAKEAIVMLHDCRCVLLVQGSGAAAALTPSLDPTVMNAQGFNEHGTLRLVGKATPAGQNVGIMPDTRDCVQPSRQAQSCDKDGMLTQGGKGPAGCRCCDLCKMCTTVFQFSMLVQGSGAAASLPPSLDPTIMKAQGFDEDGMLRLVGKATPASQDVGVMPAQFWAAGFSFSRAQWFTEVSGMLALLQH